MLVTVLKRSSLYWQESTEADIGMHLNSTSGYGGYAVVSHQ